MKCCEDIFKQWFCWVGVLQLVPLGLGGLRREGPSRFKAGAGEGLCKEHGSSGGNQKNSMGL